MSNKIDGFRLAPTDEILAVTQTAELLVDTMTFSSKEDVRKFVEKQRANLKLASSSMDKILSRIADGSVALRATTEWARRVQSITDDLIKIKEFAQLGSWEDHLPIISGHAAMIIAYLNGAGATITLYEDSAE